jgi:phage N-6-adenine-methyltransferase
VTAYVGSRVIGGDKDCWSTPEWLIEWTRAELGWSQFDFDPCAAPDTAKASDYISEETGDGLSLPWRGNAVWMNPPFSRQKRWLLKASRESRENRLKIAALVLPSFDAAYWRPAVWESAAELWMLEGRIAFERNGVPAHNSSSKSCIVVFDQDRAKRAQNEPVIRFLRPPYPPRLERPLCR